MKEIGNMLALHNDVDDITALFQNRKQLVLYGAGASAKLLVASYYNRGMKNCLRFIVDGNEALDGSDCVIDEGLRIRIISLKHFCREFKEKMQEFTLLLTPYYSLDLVHQLDEICELDGVETYIFSLIANKKTSTVFDLKETSIPVIPKKLHYFWLGGSDLPDDDKKNIETWRKFCPDYEIIRWDESNYDFTRYKYTKEAMEKGQYMYATDLARKDVLYTYGGIYFDTDVELLRPIDDLLYNEAFIGIDDGGQLNSGSGLGAVKGHPAIRELLELYDHMAFVNSDGSLNLSYNTFYETKYMIQKGFVLCNKYQKINGISCFPREVLMPEGVIGLYDDYTKNTFANHKINPYDKTECRKVLARLDR